MSSDLVTTRSWSVPTPVPTFTASLSNDRKTLGTLVVKHYKMHEVFPSASLTTKFSVCIHSVLKLIIFRPKHKMKYIIAFLLAVAVAFTVSAQSSCQCRQPIGGETCNVIVSDGDGTCTSVTQPCTQCRCDTNGPLVCPIIEVPRLTFNSSGGGQCSISVEPLVQCPSVLPDIAITCCEIAGEGSSQNVPCSLQNYRDFVPAGKSLVSARTLVTTNITLTILAVNVVPSTPGPWLVSYVSAWTFNFEPGLPVYFSDFVAYELSFQGTIPAGTASETVVVSRGDLQEDVITGALFADLVAQVGPIDFLASYEGVSEGSNTQSIIATFNGTPCLEYTFA